jgi:hypothetical protein
VAAIQQARQVALPRSVRGLLCPGKFGRVGHSSCNWLLGGIDHPAWLAKVLAYLKNPPARKIIA